MYKFLSQRGTVIGFGLGLLIVAIFVISMATSPHADEATRLMNSDQPVTKADVEPITMFDAGLYGSYFLIVASFILAIVLSIYNAAKGNPKNILKFGIGVLLLAVVLGIGYVLAPADEGYVLQRVMEQFDVTSRQSTFISTAINGAIGLLAIGGFVLFASELRNMFK
jgi:hypothetical protein